MGGNEERSIVSRSRHQKWKNAERISLLSTYCSLFSSNLRYNHFICHYGELASNSQTTKVISGYVIPNEPVSVLLSSKLQDKTSEFSFDKLQQRGSRKKTCLGHPFGYCPCHWPIELTVVFFSRGQLLWGGDEMAISKYLTQAFCFTLFSRFPMHEARLKPQHGWLSLSLKILWIQEERG